MFGSGSGTQITGTFANYPDGALIDLGTHNGQEYAARIHYTAHSVVLDSFIPIPEPGSLALTIFGGAAGLRSVRRRFGVGSITVQS